MTETRERLIEATRRCLSRKGLAATTSRDISSEARANLAAITYYFGSKEDLVAAALLDGLRQFLSPAIDVLLGDGEPAERTMTAIRTLTETFERHRSEAPAYLEALLLAPRMDAVRQGLLALWVELRGLLADQMTEMKRAGLLPAWVEPVPMASLLIAVANGLVLQGSVDTDGPEFTAMAGQFGALLVAARQ